MRLAFARAVASRSKVRMQYAALPWRLNRGELEVLLITTLKSRRWIVPKGWPAKSLSPQQSAAREARQEAGVDGAVSDCPVGAFPYFKSDRHGTPMACLAAAGDRPLRRDNAGCGALNGSLRSLRERRLACKGVAARTE